MVRVLVTAALLACASASTATLISVDLYIPGDQLATYDPATDKLCPSEEPNEAMWS